MIIENIQKSDLQVIGDIKQIKASIDVENLDFITTLLSSNLYSQPFKSFIREIVSNAWDSHVEANNTKEPVIIKLSNEKVSIRDYGTGLSKEDFEDLYCKIGSSSKRQSNKYIGCFGLGHLSPLAVSDIVYITDYYNGKALNYVMIKENGTITTNFLGENDTEEKNGLLITISGYFTSSELYKDTIDLAFFPNVFVDYSAIETAPLISVINANEAKVVRYKHFSVCNMLKYKSAGSINNKSLYILLGNVLYPLDIGKIKDRPSFDIISRLKNCNICFNINIGEINVTPNREDIIYSKNTIEIIEARIEDAIKEINSYIENLAIKDTSDIKDYYNLLESEQYWDPYTNTLTNEYSGTYKCEINLKFKGERKSEDFNKTIRQLGYCLVSGFKNYYCNSTFYTNKGLCYSQRKLCTFLADKFLAIEGNKSISGYTKEYIKSHPKCWKIPIISIDTAVLRHDLMSATGYGFTTNNLIPAEVLEAIDLGFKHVTSNITIISKKEIDDYKKDCLARVIKTDKIKDSSLYSLNEMFFTNEHSLNSHRIMAGCNMHKIINQLKRSKRCLIHCGKEFSKEDCIDCYKLTLLGIKIYWVSTKLFHNLCKYKKAVTNKKEFNNVYFSTSEVLDNLDKNSEIKIVYSQFINKFDNKNLATIILATQHLEDYILSNTKRTKIDNTQIISNIQRSSLFNTYMPKTYKAKCFQKYLNDNFWLINKYIKTYESIQGLDIAYISTIRDVTNYKMYKWCIKNHIFINYKECLKNKKINIIKTLYE